MKLTSLFALAVYAPILANGAATVHPRDTDKALAPPPPACADPRTAVPLYRTYNSNLTDHFYTVDYSQYANAIRISGYTDEGVTGWVFDSAQPGTIPLYRLWSVSLQDHFYTINASERRDLILFGGYADEGITGYVYPPDAVCGGVALWRLYNVAQTDHFYTTSVGERNQVVASPTNDVLQGNAGFILPF